MKFGLPHFHGILQRLYEKNSCFFHFLYPLHTEKIRSKASASKANRSSRHVMKSTNNFALISLLKKFASKASHYKANLSLPPGAQKTQFFQLSFIFLRTVAPKLKKLESHTTSHFEAL